MVGPELLETIDRVLAQWNEVRSLVASAIKQRAAA
jgi:hypothetical protein